MLYCNSCKVQVMGDKPNCPLCGSELTGKPEPATQLYPDIPPPKYSRNFLIKLATFFMIAGITISASINILVPTKIWWSLFVSAALICSWITLIVGITKRSNILKNILWQLFLLSAFAILWDFLTGWRGWSLDYVFPSICVVSMASMFILSKIFKIPARELTFYLVLDSVYGIVPIIFVLTNLLHIWFPSILCIMCSVISIAAILLFEWKNIKEVFARKFHF